MYWQPLLAFLFEFVVEKYKYSHRATQHEKHHTTQKSVTILHVKDLADVVGLGPHCGILVNLHF